MIVAINESEARTHGPELGRLILLTKPSFISQDCQFLELQETILIPIFLAI